jgi:hypothetical protein
MYDTSLVQMGPVLLFAPDLELAKRTEARATFRLGEWSVCVASAAADELLALRASLGEFVQRSVGEPPGEIHAAATEALSRIFSAHAPVETGDDGEEEAEGEAAAPAEEEGIEEGGAAAAARWDAPAVAGAQVGGASPHWSPQWVSPTAPAVAGPEDADMEREPPASWDDD